MSLSVQEEKFLKLQVGTINFSHNLLLGHHITMQILLTTHEKHSLPPRETPPHYSLTTSNSKSGIFILYIRPDSVSLRINHLQIKNTSYLTTSLS